MVAGRATPPAVIAEVVAAKTADMDKSVRAIERELSVPKSTVHDILEKELGRLGQEEDLVKHIVQQDLENIALMASLARKEVVRRHLVAEEGRGVEVKELAGLMSDATKRRQLFTGGATENVAIEAKTYLPEMDE